MHNINNNKTARLKEIHSRLELMAKNDKLWLWQDSLSPNKRPPLFFGHLKKLDLTSSFIELTPADQFHFKPEQNINILCSISFTYFQSPIKHLSSHSLLLPIPKTLSILSQDIIDNLELLSKEDEKSNMHLRQTPRTQIKKSKTIEIQKANDPMEKSLSYPFYDMSQTGAGFLVNHPSEFEAAQKVIIKSLDNKPMPKEIRGEVKSIMEMEEGHLFKVGIKFDSQKKSINKKQLKGKNDL